jgi:hypothetical protein
LNANYGKAKKISVGGMWEDGVYKGGFYGFPSKTKGKGFYLVLRIINLKWGRVGGAYVFLTDYLSFVISLFF